MIVAHPRIDGDFFAMRLGQQDLPEPNEKGDHPMWVPASSIELN